MPTAVITFIGIVAEAVVTGLIAVGLSEAAAIFVLDVGVKLIGLALLGNLAKKLIDIPDLQQTAKSNLVTVRGTLEHQRIVYGESLFSGPLWFMNAAGNNNERLWHGIVVAGHEIEDITNVWFDDEIIPEASIDWAGDGSVDSGWLRGNIAEPTTTYLFKFLGGPGQVASPDLIAEFSEVNSAHIGAGIAYFLTRTDFIESNTQVWSGGAPRNFKAIVRGKKVYNPNSDGTQAWGTGPHRVDDPTTWEWSDNPALCWADYMIDTDLGFGEDPARINYGYVASVAAINSVVVFTPVGTDLRFRCNGGLSTGTSHRGNLESILSSANMTMALVQGEWKLRGWEYETPTLEFDDDDLSGDMSIQMSTEEVSRYNTVRGQFIDKDRKYQAHQFPAFTSSEYVARDNSETLFRDIQLPMTTDIYTAQRLAAGILEQSDLQRKIIYPSNFKTLPVEIGGTIMLTNTKMGWSQDAFRVTNYKINDLKGINLVLQEDNAAAYTDVGTAEYTVASRGSYAIPSPGVPAPSSLWALARPEGTQIHVQTPPARLYETIKIYASVNSDAFADAVEIADIDADSYLHVQHIPRANWYWARAINFAGEFSNVVPTSGSSDVSAFPGLLGSRFDHTFDLSEDINDFFEELGQTVTISKSGGENSEHAALFDVTHFNSDGGIRTSALLPIRGDSLHVRTRYRIESWYGVSAGSQYLEFGVRGYFPTPVDSTWDKFQQTDPSTYTAGVLEAYNHLESVINQTGSWDTLTRDITMANIVGSGNTMVRVSLTWVTSDSTSVTANTRALHNTFAFHWLK